MTCGTVSLEFCKIQREKLSLGAYEVCHFSVGGLVIPRDDKISALQARCDGTHSMAANMQGSL